MGHHLIDGEFQSDKYPTTPRGKVPLSCKDPMAQDLLWQYAQRRRTVDAEFSADLQEALHLAGYIPGGPKLSEEDREKLKAQLQEIDDAESKVAAARKPYDEAILALGEVRQTLLDQHEADVAGTCECGRLLLIGELGHRCDDGPLLCEGCAPTWNELRRQYVEIHADVPADQRHESYDSDLAAIDAHIAAGDGDKKHVYEL